MARQMEFALQMGADASARLRAGAAKLNVTEAELASIDKLEAGRGTTIDVERLAPLAMALNLPWEKMWKGLLPKGGA